MYRLIILLTFAFFISCNKNNQNAIAPENVPQIMYVNSQEGLNKRSEPSINSDITGVLLYGERVITHEKSETADTIGGITSYWYRVRYRANVNEWIFGGYISENLPADLPIILGKWDNIAHEREAFIFKPNHDYSNGRKESSYGIWGSWELNGNIIKVFNLWAGEDYLAVHGELLNDEEYMQLEIIDTNNIALIFSDDSVVNFRRSNDLW